MHKRLILLSLLVLTVIAVSGSPVDKQMAEQKARKFMAVRQNAPVSRLSLAFQGRQTTLGKGKQEQDAYYYVFNKGNQEGYVVMSGDDMTAAVLGYADKGSFDPDNIPPNMKEWLDGYARQIAWGRQNSPAAKANEEETVPQKMRTVVSPLVETRWSQNSPYNLKCFTTGGSQAVTGCVATALAQVMYYHKWPQVASTAIPAYDSWEELPATTFDWDNMRLSYSSKESATDAGVIAVSQLMYYCGHAVNMSYGTSASAAATVKCVNALKNYFGYENNCETLDRNNFTKEQWESILFEELVHGRPMIYSGQSKESGHAFICDGYDGYGLFHINWGWAGKSDGYFRLQALNPYVQDTGGSKSGYAFDQIAIIGISPTVVGDELSRTPAVRVAKMELVDGDEVTVAYTGSTFSNVNAKYSYSVTATANFEMSLALYQDDKILQLRSVSTGKTIEPGSIWTYGSLALRNLGANLTDGTYQIRPVYRVKGTAEWIPNLDSDLFYINVVISSGNATLSTVKKTGADKLNFVSMEEIGGGSATKQLRLTMRNEGTKDFGGSIYLYVNDENTCYERLVVGAGEEDFADFTFDNTSTDPVSLVFKDANDEVIYQCTYTFKTSSGSGSTTPVLPTVVAYGMNNIDVSAKKMYGTTASAWFTLKNETDEDYEGKVILYTKKYAYTQGNSVYSYSYNMPVDVSLAAGETGNFKVDYPGWNYGDELWFILYLNNVEDANKVGSFGTAFSRLVVTEAYSEWDSQGVLSSRPITSTIKVSASAAAVSFTSMDITGMTITPNTNPNTIYYFAADAVIPSAFNGKNVVKGYKAAGNISFVEGYDFYVPATFNVDGQVSYTLTPSAECNGYKGWNTISLPFGVQTVTSNNSVVKWTTPGSSSEADFWVKRLDNMEGDVATFEDAASWAPNQPYLIGVPKSFLGHPLVLKSSNTKVLKSDVSKMVGGGFEFIGTTGSASLGQAYVMNALGNGFVRTSDATVSAGTAYFNAVGDASSVELIRIGGLRGDVNGDGIVGVTDVMTMVDYLLGLKPEQFIRSNAEMNDDSHVSVADVFSVVDMILLK